MKIEKLTSFYANGKIEKTLITHTNIKDMDKFFDKIIQSAKYLTDHLGRSLYVDRTNISLYLSYGKCGNLIDRIYLVKKQTK